jgi:hypothetical protein
MASSSHGLMLKVTPNKVLQNNNVIQLCTASKNRGGEGRAAHFSSSI